MMAIKGKSANFVVCATHALCTFLDDAVARALEPIRSARGGWALTATGCESESRIFFRLVDQLLEKQKSDGGWSDPEETAWAIGLIRFTKGRNGTEISSATRWLESVRAEGGGWRHHPRDHVRIPTTALISVLVPEVLKETDLDWVTTEWQRDFESPVRLSYKAGFFLLAMAQGPANDLVVRTISHLAQDQNDDGGFGPWKGHPIGSDPWSTGVVLWGLSKWIDHVDTMVIEKALDWLRKTQLPSGYWPYHYLDDGTSLALIGAVSALKALATKEKSCVQSS